MDQLIKGQLSTASANRTIELIQAKGLKPTAANTEAVLALLVRTVDAEVNIDLLRLLGTLYTPDDESRRNVSIVRSLKSFIYSGDRKLALAAIQTYARIDYQPDRTEILDYGLRSGLLDEDSYSQELALFLPLEPPAAQHAAAKRLSERNNQFGSEVLAATINDAEAAGKIAPETQQSLLTFLQKHEPSMPMAIGEFGINEGGRYADWLNTVALLTAAQGRATYADVVLAHLNDERIDPRKILGYLTSADGKRLMKRNGHRAPFADAAAKATLLADQFPGHPIFTPLARDVNLTLSGLPE